MAIDHCKEFCEFCESRGSDVATDILERICNLECSRERTDSVVTITDTHRHDMLNHTHSGYVELSGEHFDFVVENGNWNGTTVIGWGDNAGIYQPPEPIEYTLLPEHGLNRWNDSFKWKMYLQSRETQWFKDLLGKYLYDRHFAPGLQTAQYWNDQFKKKGLRFGEMEEFESLQKMQKPSRLQ